MSQQGNRNGLIKRLVPVNRNGKITHEERWINPDKEKNFSKIDDGPKTIYSELSFDRKEEIASTDKDYDKVFGLEYYAGSLFNYPEYTESDANMLYQYFGDEELSELSDDMLAEAYKHIDYMDSHLRNNEEAAYALGLSSEYISATETTGGMLASIIEEQRAREDVAEGDGEDVGLLFSEGHWGHSIELAQRLVDDGDTSEELVDSLAEAWSGSVRISNGYNDDLNADEFDRLGREAGGIGWETAKWDASMEKLKKKKHLGNLSKNEVIERYLNGLVRVHGEIFMKHDDEKLRVDLELFNKMNSDMEELGVRLEDFDDQYLEELHSKLKVIDADLQSSERYGESGYVSDACNVVEILFEDVDKERDRRIYPGSGYPKYSPR